MRILLTTAVFALLIFSGLVAFGQQVSITPVAPSGAEVREKVAADIASNYAKKDYAAVRKDFAKIMLDALSEEKLKSVWEDFIAKVGEFQKVLTTTETEKDGYRVIKKRCQFASENATIQVTFNEENKVIGLYIKF